MEVSVANLSASIVKVNTGGPYAYTTFLDGVPVDNATGFNTVALAFNAARDAIAAMIPTGENVKRVTISATTGTI